MSLLPSLSHIALVAAGGGIGAVCRLLVGHWTLQAFGPNFPWGTLIVNVVGSFLMGCLFAALARSGGGAAEWRPFLATGVLGGFTTFSAFSLDAALLWERGDGMAALSYVVGSVVLSLLALSLGLVAVRSLA